MTTSTYRRSSSNSAAVSIAWTDRDDGDFHPGRVPTDLLAARRRSVTELAWTALDQVHSADIVRVDGPGQLEGTRADGAITGADNTALSVWVGDCAPVILIGERREFAVLHAGWRGLAAGIVDGAAGAFTEPIVHAVLGPSIGVCCYEFGDEAAARVAAGVHANLDEVTMRDSSGRLFLDVASAVAAACRHHEVGVQVVGGCTGCDRRWYSHRARAERERNAVVAWQHRGEAAGQ